MDVGPMTNPHQRNLPEHALPALAEFSQLDRGDSSATLLEIIARTAPWRDWLEEAVLGGVLPHAEGIELSLRGLHAWTLLEVAESERTGADGDAIGWATSFSQYYRHLIRLLETLAAELDQAARRIDQSS